MADRLRFYFDQHIPVAVARGLRRQGVDVLTAQEADRCGLPDIDQLLFSTAQARTLVTFNSDLLTIASGGFEHAGFAFCTATRYSIGELIYALLLLFEVLGPDDMKNHIEFL